MIGEMSGGRQLGLWTIINEKGEVSTGKLDSNKKYGRWKEEHND